ncbi:MAG: hypothetical protein ACR2PA_21880 [Hyphomicrobiaceae bacterium]
MEPKVIVMVTMLAMPGADGSNVHVRQFDSPKSCIEAANIEASDPFVQHVECAALDDGMLTLQFGAGAKSKPQSDKKKTGRTGFESIRL